MIGGPPAKPAAAPPLPRRQDRSVLLVDDEPDIVAALTAGIQDRLPTVVVHGATSGPQALEVLRRQPVDLIVTDYKMPGMDGLAFLHEARRLRPGTPAIMISAFPSTDLAQRASRDYGVKMFISKPFDLDYFVDLMRTVLASSRT